MDPVLILVEWWWAAPAVAAAGAAGALGAAGVRRRARRSGRRLAVDAALHDLRASQQEVTQRRLALKVARAEHARAVAERGARRAGAEHVAAAKRMLRDRERELRAAHADVKAKHLRLSAERAALPAASAPRPLDRLRATHDAITSRWMRYETDAALQLAYPAMTDVRQPATAAYLRAAARANELRRAVEHDATPAAYSAYRDAVADLERALDEAEHRARVLAGEAPSSAWQDAAQDVLAKSAEALDQAAGAVASAFAAWSARHRPRDDR
ncbi:hypothetical protein [Microbacterium sp. XT11]|uniref:hypothetical protein n=1 Tax=Microbacterium sp. XT11 TaxID=367477 RepID=UPI000742ED6D|nr:hypothetical protein [Microbacterium sp. XT11]ALX66486.1 hypothetical protein AB663_001684 [Microbacterium sp. XT11]